jgi:hypothetical protein
MEPVGVLVAWLLGGWSILEAPGSVDGILCGVAGIMGAISFAELLPNAMNWLRKGASYSGHAGGAYLPVSNQDVGGAGVSPGTGSNESLVGTSGGHGQYAVSNRWVRIRVVIWTVVGMVGGWFVLAMSDWVLDSLELGDGEE